MLPYGVLAWTLQQGLQHLKGLARHFLLHAGPANLTGLQVHFEDPELYYPRLAGHGVHRPTCLQLSAVYHAWAPRRIKALMEPCEVKHGESATCDGTKKPPARFLTLACALGKRASSVSKFLAHQKRRSP